MDSIPRQILPVDLDLDLTLTCGQSFRWKRTEEGWLGVDGNHWALFADQKCGNAAVQIFETNREASDWNRFFRFEVDRTKLWSAFGSGDLEFSTDFSYLRGLGLLRSSAPEEVLFSFLCTSNNHLSRITTMVDRLSSLGKTMNSSVKPELTAFPTLHELSKVSEGALRSWGFGYRGATIPTVVQQLLDRGSNWLLDLSESDYGTAHSELIQLAGVGPKLADCICLYALNFQTAVPVDTHLHQAVVRRYRPDLAGKSMTANLYREIGGEVRNRFGDFAGWAQLVLYFDNLLRKSNRQGS